MATSAGASYSIYSRQAGLFLLDGTPANSHNIEEVEQALAEQIERLQTTPVQADELARIKAQVVASEVFQQDSIFYQAMQIGILETVGLGWQVMDEYVERINAVTAEQVQAVARKYLIETGQTVAVLDPLPMEAGTLPRAAYTGDGHGH